MDVSVIIPCYNAQAFIRETIQSVLAQTVRPKEILVIDDGSTDRSPQIVDEFGPAVRLVRQANRGVSHARNHGLELATAELIAFLDADDLWLPNKLERQLDHLTEECVGVYTEVDVFGSMNFCTRLADIPRDQRNDPRYMAVNNCFPTPSALLVKKSMSPRFTTWSGTAEDLVYLLELLQKGSIELVPEPLTRYRKHSAGRAASITSELSVHHAISTWLDKAVPPFSSTDVESIRSARTHLLVGMAWRLKEQRRWKEYWEFRHYLQSCPQDLEVEKLLQNRIYPALFYRVLDAMVLLSPRR